MPKYGVTRISKLRPKDDQQAEVFLDKSVNEMEPKITKLFDTLSAAIEYAVGLPEGRYLIERVKPWWRT